MAAKNILIATGSEVTPMPGIEVGSPPQTAPPLDSALETLRQTVRAHSLNNLQNVFGNVISQQGSDITGLPPQVAGTRAVEIEQQRPSVNMC